MILWDNDVRLHHRSNPSRRPQRAARSPNSVAILVTGCISSPPFLPEQGSVAASEMPGLARFPAAAHLIKPVTELRTLFCSIVPALPVRLDTQRDLSVSHSRVEIDVWLGAKSRHQHLWRKFLGHEFQGIRVDTTLSIAALQLGLGEAALSFLSFFLSKCL